MLIVPLDLFRLVSLDWNLNGCNWDGADGPDSMHDWSSVTKVPPIQLTRFSLVYFATFNVQPSRGERYTQAAAGCKALVCHFTYYVFLNALLCH